MGLRMPRDGIFRTRSGASPANPTSQNKPPCSVAYAPLVPVVLPWVPRGGLGQRGRLARTAVRPKPRLNFPFWRHTAGVCAGVPAGDILAALLPGDFGGPAAPCFSCSNRVAQYGMPRTDIRLIMALLNLCCSCPWRPVLSARHIFLRRLSI